MPNSNESTTRAISKATAFIDYIPAELRKGQEWIIVYYSKNPLTNKLERFRLRVPRMNNTRLRERQARKIIAEINRKFSEESWTPYQEKTTSGFMPFKDATDSFLKLIDKELKDGIKRADTIRAYRSYINMIHTHIKEKKIKISLAAQYDVKFATKYLDWVYYDRGNSPTTYNNHLRFLKSLASYFIQRGFIATDPTIHIKRKPKTKKIRTVLDDQSREIIREYLPQYSTQYYTLCMIPYYCMIRRTEITKLKVANFDLYNDTITIPGTSSKNGKEEHVTIPFELKTALAEHLKNANKNDFAFSANAFHPGAEQMKPKKISDAFTRFKKKYNLPDNIHWYSLKDSGITDLFMLGSLSSIQIRDQARHSDLKITELYTAQTVAGDIMVKNSGAKF
nr:tyrosine-type recombinase/integrase [uncultured Flavobacterium sp.]